MLSRDEINQRAIRLNPGRAVDRYTGTLNDPFQEAQSRYMGPGWANWFGELQKQQEDAQNEGKSFRVGWGGFGNAIQEGDMPARSRYGSLAVPTASADDLPEGFAGNLALSALADRNSARIMQEKTFRQAQDQEAIDAAKRSYQEQVLASQLAPPPGPHVISYDAATPRDATHFSVSSDTSQAEGDPRAMLEQQIQRLPANHPARMAIEKQFADQDAKKAAAQQLVDQLAETHRHNVETENTAKEAIKAKGADSKPATGAERQALSFYNRAAEAAKTVTPLEEGIGQMGLAGQARLEYAPNFLQSPEGQSYRQAQRAFTEARLRKESGAAIPPAEYENDSKTYFAQPGDSAAILEQKRKARQTVLDGLAFSSGKAYDEFYGEPRTKPGGGQAASATAEPKVGDVVNVGGKRIKISALHPDGSFDGDPVK